MQSYRVTHDCMHYMIPHFKASNMFFFTAFKIKLISTYFYKACVVFLKGTYALSALYLVLKPNTAASVKERATVLQQEVKVIYIDASHLQTKFLADKLFSV